MLYCAHCLKNRPLCLQTSFFVMTILGALENCRDLSEEQALYILQVSVSNPVRLDP